MDTIKQGLDRSNFFGVFSKSTIKDYGTFYNGSNDSTYDLLMPFLKDSFGYIKENLFSEWIKSEADGFLVINAGIEALIRIFSDIADCLTKNNINPKVDSQQKIMDEVKYYLDPLIDFFKKLTPDEKSSLKRSYGTGGRARYWRLLQKAISESRKEFDPPGLREYIQGEARQFNEDSFKMIRDIEIFMKNDFKNKLESSYGNSWFKKGVPANVYEDAALLAIKKNREVDNEEEVSAWDCLNMIDYRRIAIYGSNWKEIFEKYYTKPGEEKLRGGKEEKTKWMQKLERIRNQNFHSYSVKEDEYEFLIELYNWLITKTVQNNFELADV